MAKSAEFFSVIMGTTPDISHKEQLTLIFRFVNTNSNSAHLVEEHFIEFLEVDDTSGYGLASKFLAEKKALQALKAPKQEPEPLIPLKRPLEAKDAKELAKKLIKSGAIRVPEKTQPATEKTTFKRSIGLERKLSAVEKAPSGYQPFSTSHPEEEIHESKVKVKDLSDSFLSARDRDDRVDSQREIKSLDGKPRQGHTIHVFGFNITEEILKKAFDSYGNIVNINLEYEKNCGFVTFDKMEAAEKAITEVTGSIVCGVQLKVSLARHQKIVIESINDASSSIPWSTIAASHSQKGSHNDKRDMVSYEDNVFGQ